MEIRFTQLDFAYSALSHECGEEKYSADRYANISIGFNFSPISLPLPLDEGVLTFRRKGEIYSAYFSFWSGRKDVFRDSSKRINERFKQNKFLLWSQINKDGVGYLIENGEPYISIFPVCKGHGRLIALGSFGAKPIEVENSEDFRIHLTDLEKVINVYIECCLSPLIKASKIPPLPKHPIYISA